MKKFLLFTLIILSIFFSFQVNAEVSTTSGFIPGQIWYSKEPLIEGETINIHTAIWNGEKESYLVKVEFYDKNVILGNRDIVLNPLELKDVFISWKITSGDHLISAKIISSTKTVLGKKETVILNRVSTSSDKQFVSVLAKNNLGEPVSESDILKNQLNNIIPESVSTPVSDILNKIDAFRDKTSTKIDEVKDQTQKEIDSLKTEKDTSKIVNEKINTEDAVKKPITYIKLFLFSVLSFIFSNKIVFYGLSIFIIFLILRGIYHKIRNR